MSQNMAATYKEEFYPQGTDDEKYDTFAQFFRGKLKLLSEIEGRRITTKQFAEMFGSNYESFRKTVNKRQPTKNRDYIIAVCALLRIDADSTNTALRLYGMPELDDYHKRDEILWDILSNQPDDPKSIDEINELLTSQYFEPLYIIGNKHEEKEEKKKFPYKLVRKYTQCTMEGIGRLSEPNCFLDLLYDTECFYNIRVCMEYFGNGQRFELCVRYEDKNIEKDENIYQVGIRRRIYPENKKYVIYKYPNGDCGSEIREYDDIADTGEFRDCFNEITKTVKTEKQKLRDTVNDTRNYGSRISAKVIGGELHVFCEEYNCDVPELSEYYLMDFCGGEYTLYILDRSCFMQMYLSAEKYERIYEKPAAFRFFNMQTEQNGNIPSAAGKIQDPVKEMYISEEDIEDAAYEARDIGTFENYSENTMTVLRVKAYKRMKTQVSAMVKKLKAGKANICSCEMLGDSADKLIADYYGLSDNTAEVIVSDSEKVTLSFSDIKDGFELGLETVEEICRFMLRYGSLKIKDCL